MNIKNKDWLDCSLFLLLASAEVTDHYVTEAEINTIIEKTEGLSSRFNFDGKPITKDAVRQKFNAAFEWYDFIGESAPKNKMNDHIMTKVFEVAYHMKKQQWFSADFAQALLNDLVTLADADGETIRNEKLLINRIAQEWDLSQPFS